MQPSKLEDLSLRVCLFCDHVCVLYCTNVGVDLDKGVCFAANHHISTKILSFLQFMILCFVKFSAVCF